MFVYDEYQVIQTTNTASVINNTLPGLLYSYFFIEFAQLYNAIMIVFVCPGRNIFPRDVIGPYMDNYV